MHVLYFSLSVYLINNVELDLIEGVDNAFMYAYNCCSFFSVIFKHLFK